MAAHLTQVVVPGQPIPVPTGQSFKPGQGTYLRGGSLYASLRGIVQQEGETIIVVGKDDQQSVPEPNSVVIGTVSRITRVAATLSLLTVNGRPCRPDYIGVIRAQDVRQTAKDSVKASPSQPSSRLRLLPLTWPELVFLTDLVMFQTRRCRSSKSCQYGRVPILCADS